MVGTKNSYEVRGDVTSIFIDSPKYGKMETLIATDDLSRADEFHGTWCVGLDKPTNSFYVRGNMRSDRKNISVRLHRWILGVTDPKIQVDHVLHDTLDNCRWALNIVTPVENYHNRKMRPDNSSGYTGVEWHAGSGKWRARIVVNGTNKHLGLFSDIKDAAAARRVAEEKYQPYKASLL